MNNRDYQNAALRTSVPGKLHPPVLNNRIDILHAAIGLVTESGELLEAIDGYIFNGTPYDKVNLIEELGDTSWYHAVGYNGVGEPPQFILQRARAFNGRGTIAGNMMLIDVGLRMSIEAARLLDLMKREQFYNAQAPIDDYIDKREVYQPGVRTLLGRIGGLILIGCEAIQVPVEEVRATNIAKLRKRYPEKFTEEDAVNRNLAEERKVLEG